MLTDDKLKAILEGAGRHQDLGQPVPDDEEQRLYYGCLEILDFQCASVYGDAPDGVTDEDIRAYLVAHRGRIKAQAVSSYLGLMRGLFDFLREPTELPISSQKEE